MLSRIYRSEPDIRKRQIDTLKIFNANVIEVQEGQEYQIPFKSGNNDLVLHVSLTSDFPNDKPILRISPTVIHEYINSDGDVTKAPGLLNFSIHSDLGRLVRAIISELEKSLPPLVSDSCTLSTSPSITNRIHDNNVSYGPSQNYYSQQHNVLANSTTVNYQSAAFPELNTMNNDELQLIYSSVERQQEFLDNLPQNKETNKTIDDLIIQIEELAESNLNKQPHLEELQKEIHERIEDVTKCAFETERLNMLYQTMSDKYSPKNIKNKLLIAAEEANENCEQIAEAFLHGDLDVDKFVSDFIQKRSLAQARKTKEEKFTQQLQNLERAGF